jgi:NTP pyrophosphatase (non-canonical NTP hydrolase)
MENIMTQIDRLLGIMKRLRDPENGCPWDKEQTFATIAPYTLEETYEVLDAISREDFDDLRGELGDLLFQVVFYAQMAQEEGALTLTISALPSATSLSAVIPISSAMPPQETARSAGPLGADQKRRAGGKIPALRAGRHSAEPARADARA